MKRALAFLLTSLLALTLTGQAAAQLVSDPRRLTGLSFDELESLASESGWSTERISQNNDTVLVVDIKGRKVVLWPRACDGAGRCGGLYIFSLIPAQASSTLTNGFNVQYNPARATLRDGQVVLDRYLIGDFGITRGGLSIELQVQAKLIDDWWTYARAHKVKGTAVSFRPLLEELPKLTTVTSHLDELDLPAPLLDQIASGNGPRN
ncbi:MAG: hypothetical protein AAGA69_08705 [Pseudomonadota bacterium]